MLSGVFGRPLVSTGRMLPSFTSGQCYVCTGVIGVLIRAVCCGGKVGLCRKTGGLVLTGNLCCFTVQRPGGSLITRFRGGFIAVIEAPSMTSITSFCEAASGLEKSANARSKFFRVLSRVPLAVRCVGRTLPCVGFCVSLAVPLFSMSIRR